MRRKLGFSFKEICLIILIASLTTSLTTGIIMYNNNRLNNGAIDINKDEDLQEFLKVYASLNENYYEDIDKTGMIDSAINAMVNYLGEDYSIYLNKDETNNLNNNLSGKYKGIGISVIENNRVFKVYPDTPASRQGLKENDIILKINGEEVTKDNNVTNMIDKDNENTLEIKRGDDILIIKVKPEEINNPLTREIKENHIGYIYIPSFTNTVSEEFTKALNELEKENIDSLIIDLRGNTGGYLSGATEISAKFLEKDKTIYSLEEKEKVQTYKDDTKEKRDYKIVILVNGATASASEILTAALKESYGATIVGTKTYGKGKVQQTKKLDDGSMVKYTTAKWYTPNGTCIDEIGIFPDYNIELAEDEEGNYTDTQLQKALELLR